MKINRSLIISLCLMIIISALYRIMPNRPWGFAPQIAIGLFSGALFVNDKKVVFALPLISMFLSDVLYQVLYNYGVTQIYGFYGSGQIINYLLFVGITAFGFLVNKNKIGNVVIAAIAAPTAFFLISNFLVWASDPALGYGLNRPRTFTGLILTYSDALSFYRNSVIGTIVFSAVLFSSYYLAKNAQDKKQLA